MVYTSSYCRTKQNIIKFGNSMTEMHFDLDVEPVSNSTELIVMYVVNIHAKFWREICKQKQDGTCARPETSRTCGTSKDEAATAYFAMAQSKTADYSNMYHFLSFVACRAICQRDIQCWKCSGRENSFLQVIARNPGWWDLVWTSYTDKQFKKTFRISKGTLHYILRKIRRDLEKHTYYG